MSKIAWLVPCYNEEKTIAKVIKDCRKNMPDSYIYIYNNNSTDRTYEIAYEFSKHDKKIFVKNEFRQGKGNVIRTMLRDIDADCYLIIDGDDTYPTEIAQKMADYILNGQADMVIGDRISSTYLTQNKRLFHNFGNLLVIKLINIIFNSNIKDIMTGYRAINKFFAKSFPVISKGFEIETEMSIHAIDKNFLLKEVPVKYRNRPEGSKSKLNTYSDGFKVLKTIFRLFEEYRPLLFFGTIALLFFIINLIIFIPVFTEYLKTGLVPKLPSLIVSGVFLVCSLLSFSVGVILDFQVKKHRIIYEILLNFYFKK